MSSLVAPPGRQGPGAIPSGAVSALDLRIARRAAGRLPGEHLAPGAGNGTELERLRPYEVGDDVRQLDAAASARTGEPHVRLQVPERALTTWILVDLSPSMAFGTAERLKSDVAEGGADVVARLAARRGGRVGLMTCGVPAPRVLPPLGGRRALGALRRAVGQGVAPDGHDDPAALRDGLVRLRRLAHGKGLVVVLSDLREESAWPRALRGLALRHRVLVAEVTDPREAELPDAGLITVVDPETGRLVEADTASALVRERFAAAEAERRAGVAQAIRRAGAAHVVLSTDGDWLRDLGRVLR